MMFREWFKISKQKTVFCLLIGLLFCNVFFLYLFEKNTLAYHYVYEQRSDYEAFLAGDEVEDPYGFYREDREKQKQYVKSYATFIEEMDERSDSMKSISIFSNKQSFSYRNIEKTNRDFSLRKGTKVKVDNCYGVVAFANYELDVLFVLLFVGVMVWCVFYYERNRGLMVLLKCTKKGHIRLALAKLGVMMSGTFFYVVLQETMTIACFAYWYGFGNLNRSIQSVSLFRNCPYALNVWQMLFVTFLVRVIIAEFFALTLYCIGIWVRNECLALVVSGAFLGMEFLASRLFSIQGSMNLIKSVNPFFCWNPAQSLGCYQNLNLFGWAIGKNKMAAIMGIVLGMLFILLGTGKFCYSYQVATNSRLEKVMLWLRRKTGIFWRHTNLLRFEGDKILFQQKKIVVMILLVFWGISEVKQAQSPVGYSTAKIAAYHAYLKEISGPVTDESIDYVEQKERRIAELEKKLAESQDSADGKTKWERRQLQNEYDLTQEAVSMLSEQLESLRQKPGNLYEKYWVDELAYEELWRNTGRDIGDTVIECVAFILFAGGIYPADEKKKILPLLYATKGGRGKLNRNKNRCAVLGIVFIFALVQVPNVLRYYAVDQFQTAEQMFRDFTQIYSEKTMCLGEMFGLLFLLKAVVFALASILTIVVSRWIKNEFVTNIVCIGMVCAVAVLCLCFRINIATALIYWIIK